MPIRDATPEDSLEISALVQASFRAHVAADWQPDACERLLLEIQPEVLVARILDSPVVLLYQGGGRILGVILLRRPNLVHLCFVASGYTGRGIGRSLWEAARARLEDRFPEVRTVELNASPYAVPAYKAFGFYPISEQLLRDGAVFTRMACWLPARAIATVSGAV